jgi:cytochrome c oxidase assembly factor CtaG
VLAAAPATPGFGDWSFGVPLVLIVLLAVLYRLGDRRTITPARTAAAQRWHGVAFYAALLMLVIALCSPLDALSEQLFWAHMVQHILLMLVVAPLIVIARPWIRLWRALPLASRRRLGRWLARGERAAPLRSASRLLGGPAAGLVAFSAVLAVWHLPGMFDATLRSSTLHALEHTLFLLAAVMLFKQMIPSPPLQMRLAEAQRILYAVAAMVVSWVLAVVLALAPDPLYGFYAHLPHRPGGISALADQQIAAGVMWVPGSITFVIVIFVYVHRWLAAPGPAGPGPARPPRLAGGH